MACRSGVGCHQSCWIDFAVRKTVHVGCLSRSEAHRQLVGGRFLPAESARIVAKDGRALKEQDGWVLGSQTTKVAALVRSGLE